MQQLDSAKYTAKGFVYNALREGRLFRRFVEQLEKTQWQSIEQLEQLQLARLQDSIANAFEHVPYYKGVAKMQGLSIRDFSSLADLNKLPFLTKQDVFSNNQKLLSNQARSLFLSKSSTSGTTGTPLDLYRDMSSVNYEHATIYRHWNWAGYQIGDPFVTIRGEFIENRNRVGVTHWAKNLAKNELVMSSFHLSPETIPRYLDEIASFQPKYIYCYPQSLQVILRYLAQQNSDLRQLGIKGVFTSSEMVNPELWELSDSVLNARIYDYYNMAERVVPIVSCEIGNYHVVDDYGVAEFEPIDVGKGTYELIGTGLTNKAMPLFRYRTGDVIELDVDSGKCDCGRDFRRVKRIVGRPSEYIFGADGQVISGAGMTHIFYDVDTHVLETQIELTDKKRVLLKVVASPKFSTSSGRALTDSFKKYTGIDAELEVVSNLERTQAGKFKFIVHRQSEK